MAPDALPDPVGVALVVVRHLESLRVPYVIGGSFASSLHGEPRSTNGVDIVAGLDQASARGFVESLGPGFYADAAAAVEAVRSGSAFNIVHIATAVKVDVFTAGTDPFDKERLNRRQRIVVDAPDGAATLYVDTPEDVVLRKLEWYRRGGETSERQWRDVLAVLRVQKQLDDAHLSTWAGRLGVAELLLRARAEAARR